jgi:glycosidase
MVINHTSSQHPWFKDAQTPGSERDQWYRWSDGDKKPPQIGPWGQEVWYKLGSRYYYAVFWDGMPDLNFRKPAVTQAVDDIAKYWLVDMGSDGFRMDGARYYVEDPAKLADSDGNLAWTRDYNTYINSVKPDAFTVAELWTNSPDVAKYMPDSFDMGFEFDLAQAMLDSARRGTNEAVTPIQARALGLYKPGQYAPFLTNHDGYRLMNEMGKNPDKVKIAASMLLTGGGVPFIYYGEEIGMVGGKPDECIRTPMQWDATTRVEDFMAGKDCVTNEATFNVAAEETDPTSLLTFYRNLIHLRNDHSALRVGSFVPVQSSNKAVYSFIRQSSDEAVLVVINLGKSDVTDYTLSAPKTALTGDLKGTVLFGDGTAKAPKLGDGGAIDSYTPITTLAPYSTAIIQLQSAS